MMIDIVGVLVAYLSVAFPRLLLEVVVFVPILLFLASLCLSQAFFVQATLFQ